MKKYLTQIVLGMGLIIGSSNMVNAQWTKTIGASSTQSFAMKGSTVYAGTATGIYMSSSYGKIWTKCDNIIPYNSIFAATSVIVAANSSTVFAGAFNYKTVLSNGGFFRSADNGASWVACNAGLPDSIVCHFLATSGTSTFGGTNAGLFRSTDNGENWTDLNTGLPIGTKYTALATLGTTIYGGTTRGLFRSTNNGTTWTTVESDPVKLSIRTLATIGNTLFAGTGFGVYRSTDNGTTFTEFDSGLTNKSIVSFAVSGNNIFVLLVGGGIFRSTVDGSNWTEFNTGLATPLQYVQALAVCDTVLFAGSGTDKVWSVSISGLSSAIKNGSPNTALHESTFKLASFSQSNRNVTVSFALPHSNQLTIGVYDVRGLKIATIVDKNIGSGLESFIWNTNKIAAGCYTIRFQVGSNSFAKSILITQ